MIREYNKTDLSECARIFKEAFSEEAWGCVWTQERVEEAPAKQFYEKNGFQVSDGVICMYWV